MDGVRRAALLHHDWGDPRVVGAGLEERPDGVRQNFARDIVDVGFEEHDRLTL